MSINLKPNDEDDVPTVPVRYLKIEHPAGRQSAEKPDNTTVTPATMAERAAKRRSAHERAG